jgi:ferredoxin
MKILICYYSSTGNTKLTCEYISRNLKAADVDLFDITTNTVPDFDKYKFIGLAAFTDFWGPSQIVYDFIEKIEMQENKSIFVLNTYGFISARTLKELEKLAMSKGFDVVSGFSLHTPESYPPMRKKNKTYYDSPNEKELSKLNEYIKVLNKQIQDINDGNYTQKKRIKKGFLGTVAPKFSRKYPKKDLGVQVLNDNLCIACGKCKELCPYNAIELSPKPIFDHDKCYGCWSCYNHCPKQAISTSKIPAKFQYSKPSDELIKKLG